MANTTEFVLPSAHPCPRRKRQIDWFGRFCIAHDRKSAYFRMGAPFPENCPFPWGSGPLSNTRYLGHIRAHNPNGIYIGSAVFAGLTSNRPTFTRSVAIHIYLYAVLWCGLIMTTRG